MIGEEEKYEEYEDGGIIGKEWINLRFETGKHIEDTQEERALRALYALNAKLEKRKRMAKAKKRKVVIGKKH